MRFFTPRISALSFSVSSLLLVSASSLYAQDGSEYAIVLPEAAQACVLPAAPDAIPEDADKDTILAARKEVGRFQTEVEAYRACLSEAEEGEITEGNQEAIVASYNYSVEMEERVAARYNEAVRAYNERQGEG